MEQTPDLQMQPKQENKELDQISFSSNSNSDGDKSGRRKKGYERRRSPRGLSNSKSPKSNSNQKSPKRSRSRSNKSEFKEDQENDSRQGEDDDRERKRASRRAARQDEGRGQSPQGDGYYKSYRDDRYQSRRHRIQYPPMRDRLYTRKDFDQYQTSRFDKQELTDSYNEYVKLYKKEQEYEFYQDHKSEPWFVERYNPGQIHHWKINQIDLSQYNSNKFKSVIESLKTEGEASQYCQLKLDTVPEYDYNLLQDGQGQDILLPKAPLFSFDTDSQTLYLKYIPVHIKRQELTELLQEKLKGFVHLSMSEPMRNHGFERLAWVNFENDHDTTQALQKIESYSIDNFKLSAARSLPNKKRTPIRIAPPLPERQILNDFELCKHLITKVFDPEKKIDTFIIDELEKIETPLTQVQKLDILLLYLRRVHAYCLYCGEEYEDERMLSTRCGPQHIRNYQKIPDSDFQEILDKCQDKDIIQGDDEMRQPEGENPEAEDDAVPKEKKSDVMKELELVSTFNIDQISDWGGSITFLQKYVSQALKRITDGPRSWADPYQNFIENDQIEWCRSNCKLQDYADKQKCYICTICLDQGLKKRFTTLEFAVKHIQNMHKDVIDETYQKEQTVKWVNKTVKDIYKKEMKQNYFKDENKLFNQPGRKYTQGESSYYTGQRDGDERNNYFRGDGRRGGFRGGARAGRYTRGGRDEKSYVDLDDPERHQKDSVAQERGQVDYGDLFG